MTATTSVPAATWEQEYAQAQARYVERDDTMRWTDVRDDLIRREVGERRWDRLYAPTTAPPLAVLGGGAGGSAIVILGCSYAIDSTLLLLAGLAVAVVGLVVVGLVLVGWHDRHHEYEEDSDYVEDVDELVRLLNPASLDPSIDAQRITIEQHLAPMVGEALLHLRLTDDVVGEAFDIARRLREIAHARRGAGQRAWMSDGFLDANPAKRRHQLDRAAAALSDRVAALSHRAGDTASSSLRPALSAARTTPPNSVGGGQGPTPGLHRKATR